jgi:hypothetical protein
MQRVVGYTSDALRDLLVSRSISPEHVVRAKVHNDYLHGYLTELGVKTIVVEREYVDRDYLEDYAAYYVRSFHPYERYCSRLHFFSSEFDEDGFYPELLKEKSVVICDEAYLGYVVIKPLPNTIIGRTCLRTFRAKKDKERHFPIIRHYRVNLFGKPLIVDAIAYQEQDNTVAACASTAAWSAFQQTGALFHHAIPSPVEITLAALEHFPFGNRHLPNKGLTAEQIAHAIRNVGLEPLVLALPNSDHLNSLVYAYLNASIPVVLGVMIQRLDNPIRDVDGHAVTILGYQKRVGPPTAFPGKPNFFLESSRICKFYAHDDQVGPYARMEHRSTNCLTTSYGGSSFGGDTHRARFGLVLIPVHHKIRISHELILRLTAGINAILFDLNKLLGHPLGNLFWDVTLTYSNEFKQRISCDAALTESARTSLLTTGLPKYVWLATVKNPEMLITFIFDATDIDQGNILVGIVNYSNDATDLLMAGLPDSIISASEDNQLRRVLEKTRSFLSATKSL